MSPPKVITSFTICDIETIHRDLVVFKTPQSLSCCICNRWTDYAFESGTGNGLHISHTQKIDDIYYILPRIFPEHIKCIEMFNLCPPIN